MKLTESIATAILLAAAAGCSKREPAVRYGEVYSGTADGATNYYCRSEADGQLWFWMWTMNSQSSYGATQGSWSRVPQSSVPANLKAMGKSVDEKDGEPEGEAVDDESLTPSEQPETMSKEASPAEETEPASQESPAESAPDESPGGESGGDSGGAD